MHSTYTFDFLETISEQLKSTLEELEESPLNDGTLQQLSDFQTETGRAQGVYLLHYQGAPVYVGKANDVSERLFQHRRKLLGRQNIDQDAIGYKALLLDKSMSTAANEDVLIALFKQAHSEMWNGRGFGPKDPGQNRDTTKPSWFDRMHPIIHDYPIPHLADTETVGRVLEAMKRELPYVFRYQIDSHEQEQPISLAGVHRGAETLLKSVVNALGPGWRGAVISYGMLLYKHDKEYPHGKLLLP